MARREDRGDIRVALEVGAALIDEAAARAAGSDAAILTDWSSQLRDSLKEAAAEVQTAKEALDAALAAGPAGPKGNAEARAADFALDTAWSATLDWLTAWSRLGVGTRFTVYLPSHATDANRIGAVAGARGTRRETMESAATDTRTARK